MVDSVFHIPSVGSCGGFGAGLTVTNTEALIERNKFYIAANGSAVGATLNASQVQLYDDYFYSAKSLAYFPCVNGPAYSAGLVLSNATMLWATGNTVDGAGDPSQGEPSYGLSCDNNSTVQFESNLVAGGAAPNHYMAFGTPYGGNAGPGCFASPSAFKDNYFWYEAAGAPSSGDLVGLVATQDAGVPDPNGNIFGSRVSCYDATLTQPDYHLAAGSPCINRGETGTRLDGSAIAEDVDGNPRTLGSAPDIGCSEKQ
jgi:hypothetical protein